jgi:hypothetical protein
VHISILRWSPGWLVFFPLGGGRGVVEEMYVYLLLRLNATRGIPPSKSGRTSCIAEAALVRQEEMQGCKSA